MCLFAFNVKGLDVYTLATVLKKERGWDISPVHLPKGVHVCVTPANYENVSKNFAKDVSECM